MPGTSPRRSPRPLDRFIPAADFGDRHETIVRAPASVAFETAASFDLTSIPLVKAIFWLRGKVLGATAPPPTMPAGLVAATSAIGWGELSRVEGRELVMGAVTAPWMADVTFRSVPPDQFAAFAEPDLVKIAWTIEAEPLDSERSLLATETRVVATDEEARRKFRRYWLVFGAGIVLIRLLALPAMRRAAEKKYST